MAETPRHGDIVADTENVLQTVFVYINVNSFCFSFLTVMKKISATFGHFSPEALHTGMNAFHF